MTSSLPAKLALLSVLPLFQTDAKVLEKVLAKDDEAFAKELSRAGYDDLAEDVIRAMTASGRGGGNAELLVLDIAAYKAAREMDPVKRLELLETGIKEREDFIAAHPGTPEAAEIQASQLEQYRTVGELITSVVEEGTSPDTEALRERGLEIFNKAVKELEAQRTQLEERPATPLTEEQQADHDLQRMFNLYGLVRTNYFRAALYPHDPEGLISRQLIIESALRAMLDLQLDFPDQFVCYEGYIYEGLCHKAVDAFPAAIESFDAAIAIREAYPEEKGVYTLDPGAADIVSSAVLQKMLLLSLQGDQAGTVAVAEDFAARTPDPWKTLKGLSILSEQATAYRALGNEEAVASTAKTLIATDPNGPGGKRGRELLGEGSAVTLGAVGLLRLAESSLQNEPDHAMELCQQAMALARGTPDVANTSARAGLLLGALYAQRGSPHEAAVVWDSTAARFPKGKDAPECLWRAIKGYLNLQGQERRAIYKDLAQARLADLTRLYPEHPYSAQAFIIEGQQAEAEQDFKRAADIYQKLAPGAAGYEEGLYRAGNAWSRMARDHFAASRVTEGKEAAKKAEDLLKKAREELVAAGKKTLETSEQQRFADLAFSARTSLGELYLMPGVERAAEVVPLFQGAESELADDAARMSTVWELRFRALSQEKKLDEAMALFDARVKENPSARWLTAGAGVLAPILDSRGMELRQADPASKEADRLWQKAASNYQLAIKGQLEGRESVQMETLESVADRLFLFALHFEGLPETTDSFVDYGGKPLSNELLDTAVRAYELLVPLTPSYRTAIKLARTEAFLGRWEEAAQTYADLFQRENFADPVSKTINQEAVAAKPELIFAYIEWGVAEREIGVEQGNDTTRLQRASGIFEALVMGTQQESKLWWQSKFYQVQTMVDRGAYDVADVALKSLKRNWEHYDANQYGLEERFKKLDEDVGKKVFKKK